MCAGNPEMMGALKRVAVLLKESDIPFALAGSYAAYARGGVPSEHDVDFVLRQQDVERAVSILVGHDLIVSEPPEDWLIKAFIDGCQVDLIFRLPFGDVDDELLSRAEELRIDSVRMPALSATDLLIAKLLSLHEHHCDFEPVLRLVRSLREQVDWQRVRNSTSGSPFARALLILAHDLDLLPPEQLSRLGPTAVGTK